MHREWLENSIRQELHGSEMFDEIARGRFQLGAPTAGRHPTHEQHIESDRQHLTMKWLSLRDATQEGRGHE